jgi:hypothetical protein
MVVSRSAVIGIFYAPRWLRVLVSRCGVRVGRGAGA